MLLVFIFFSPLLAQGIFACSCNGTSTPYEALKQAKTVFVGKVVGVKDASGKEIVDEKITDYGEYARKNEGTRYYRFEVQEFFKGAKTSEVTVASKINMCQFGFDVGESHLVYAYESDSGLWANLFCSRTDWIKTSQDDVYFLRDLLKNKPEPRIYGSVQIDDKDPATGSFQYIYLKGIKIVAKSRKRRFVTVTDKNGLYSFGKLPNGRYKVYPELPKEYVLDSFYIREINLSSKDELFNSDFPWKFTGHNAYSEFKVRWNKQISGKQK